MEPIRVIGYRCERCRHEWVPRSPNRKPRVCPKCKSPYWDMPREDKREGLTEEVLAVIRAQVEKARGMWKHLAPGRSLVDELIQERREEAARE